ncbi:MAG: hypothetical protein ABFD21_00260, partial [Anaerolineaceae bacterium]
MNTVQVGTVRLLPAGYQAFIPTIFPPKAMLDFPKDILMKNSDATLKVGELKGITRLLPDIDFFLWMYLRKDAA